MIFNRSILVIPKIRQLDLAITFTYSKILKKPLYSTFSVIDQKLQSYQTLNILTSSITTVLYSSILTKLQYIGPLGSLGCVIFFGGMYSLYDRSTSEYMHSHIHTPILEMDNQDISYHQSIKQALNGRIRISRETTSSPHLIQCWCYFFNCCCLGFCYWCCLFEHFKWFFFYFASV